jgi:exopolysaccharide production protein ExoQ
MLAALVVLFATELTFGISRRFSESLGRGGELSGRTGLWTALLAMHTNPILGTGFESFWLGERPNQLEGIFFFIPNEAHNGYLETYLTLGSIGVFLVLGLFVATFLKIRVQLFRNFEMGRYRLGFLAAIVLYNWTEAAFKTLNPLWFVFYLIAMDYPRIRFSTAQTSMERESADESRELVYAEAP